MRSEVSEEVSAEVVSDDPVDAATAEIRDRVLAQMKISQVIRDYVAAEERFESASKAFSESCDAVRKSVKPNTTVVVRQYYGQHHLVTSDDEGNFDVKPIEII